MGGWEDWGLIAKGYASLLGGDENGLKLIEAVLAQLCTLETIDLHILSG